MNQKYKYTKVKKDLFLETFEENIDKSYLIETEAAINLEGDTTTLTGVYFKFDIKKENNDLIYEIELQSWSNDLQKHVRLDQSVWIEDGFLQGKHIPTIVEFYSVIIENFFRYLDTINIYWKLKNFIHTLENPLYQFHYKLLNQFSQETLEKIMKESFDNYPILNILLFQKQSITTPEVIFLPHSIDGFYIDGIEVSVDLNESDYPLIEDMDSGEISGDEFLKRVLKCE